MTRHLIAGKDLGLALLIQERSAAIPKQLLRKLVDHGPAPDSTHSPVEKCLEDVTDGMCALKPKRRRVRV
jgi:hypothetical protein